MDLKVVKAIYKFMKETDIVEIEVEGPDGKVRLKRGSASGEVEDKESEPPPPSKKAA